MESVGNVTTVATVTTFILLQNVKENESEGRKGKK